MPSHTFKERLKLSRAAFEKKLSKLSKLSLRQVKAKGKQAKDFSSARRDKGLGTRGDFR